MLVDAKRKFTAMAGCKEDLVGIEELKEGKEKNEGEQDPIMKQTFLTILLSYYFKRGGTPD